MFAVTVTFEIELDDAPAFMQRAKQQARDSLANEAGCHRFDVCVDPKKEGRFLFYEIYDDAKAFMLHLESAHFQAFEKDVYPVTRSKAVQSWTLC